MVNQVDEVDLLSVTNFIAKWRFRICFLFFYLLGGGQGRRSRRGTIAARAPLYSAAQLHAWAAEEWCADCCLAEGA